MPLCSDTDEEAVQVVKLCYLSLKLAVVCGSFAPELDMDLRSSSRRAEHSLLMARSHLTALTASQQLMVSEGKVILSQSCCDYLLEMGQGWLEEGRAWISLLRWCFSPCHQTQMVGRTWILTSKVGCHCSQCVCNCPEGRVSPFFSKHRLNHAASC